MHDASSGTELELPQQRRAEDRPVDRLRNQRGERRAVAVVEREESRRLQAAPVIRAVVLARHARMHVREQRQKRNQQNYSVDDADDGADQPAAALEAREDEVVDEGEQPAAEQVED